MTAKMRRLISTQFTTTVTLTKIKHGKITSTQHDIYGDYYEVDLSKLLQCKFQEIYMSCSAY